MSPENLLDIVRNFVVFERDVSTGKVIKKVPRYQQFGAVNKALARASHRQGAGQDRRGAGRRGLAHPGQRQEPHDAVARDQAPARPTHENPTLVLVTDRRDLDRQITGVFQNCGFPEPRACREREGPAPPAVRPERQDGDDDRAEVPGGGGISAGGKRVKKLRHPVLLSEASNIFVMTDEAHRTQYGSLGANLRAALPNAVFFGFTGTPIDKKDRSTISTFGPYIDQYTIEQAVADEATVPIFYESRMADLHIIGQTLDRSSTACSRTAPTRSGRRSSRSTPPSRPSPRPRGASRRSAWT